MSTRKQDCPAASASPTSAAGSESDRKREEQSLRESLRRRGFSPEKTEKIVEQASEPPQDECAEGQS
jgi:SOS response regulatory protein OraA/RecX